MPSGVTNIMSNYVNTVDLSGAPTIDFRTYLDFSQPINITQATIDAAVLNLISTNIGFAGGLISLIGGSVATGVAGVGVPIADFKRITGWEKFRIAEYSFAQGVYKDINSFISGTDYLGDAARYIKMWNSLQKQLGSLNNNLSGQMSQLSTATSLLQDIADQFSSTSS